MKKSTVNTVEKDKFIQNNGLDFEKVSIDDFVIVGPSVVEAEHISSKPYSYWKSVGKILITSPTFIIALIVLIGLIITMFVVAPPGIQIVPDVGHRPGDGPAAPSWAYPFGLGIQGNDYAIEVWAGFRVSLLFGLLLVSIQAVVGIILGSIWGYFRKTDFFFINLVLILGVTPMLIFILFITFLFGTTSFWVVVFAISLQLWISLASTTRLMVLLVKNTDYNTASVFMASNGEKIIRRNILPRILPVLSQTIYLTIPSMIGFDATLSYLGFGFVDIVTNRDTSLGTVISKAMKSDWIEVYPHLIVFPIVLLTLVSFVFFLIGRVFSDSLDPKNHNK